MSMTPAFDIRYPIGGLFVVLAALLVPYGLFVQPPLASGDINIDLWWGLCMLVFGIALLALARAADRRHRVSGTIHSGKENDNA